MTKQTLKRRELISLELLAPETLQQRIEEAIALEDHKATLVARTGRQYYAKAAIRKLAVELGLFELVDVETTVSAKPDVELTDREKAERIMQRNEKRGWQTSTEVKLVASGQAETFADAKAMLERERAVIAAEAAETKSAPKRRSSKQRSSITKPTKKGANALTTTRAE